MALKPQHVAPELLNKVTKVLGITALDQWYYVSNHVATKAIGTRTLNKFGDLAGFLKSAYPQHRFDEEKLTTKRNQEKDQKFIEVIVKQLFPNTEIYTKAKKAVGIINPETEAYLEIDFWIPSLKLGIEYQDKHHYGYQWYANDTLENYQKRDDIKKVAMEALGYTLITIGYWWDKTKESVAATIRKVRPDLLQEFEHSSAEPIPSDPPPSAIPAAPVIPGVAGIMSPFTPGYNFDPTNWFGGEKLDGIRGIYNPELNKMFSRAGNELSVLPTLLNDIPAVLVEGEIVAGRGNYNKTSAVSYHTSVNKVNWSAFRYVVFDMPNHELGNYTQRYSTIVRSLFDSPHLFTQIAFRVLLQNKEHLKTLMDAIINDAGEGVIAQQDSRYEYGRAPSLAKIKVRRDADAQVVRVNEDSCTCNLTSGLTADISFCTGFDSRDLKVGDIVSYYYQGYYESGLPKRGEIYKVRYDITWESLVSGSEMQNTTKKAVKDALGGRALISDIKAKYKLGHWNKSTNVRAFFDEFARTAGFDPLVPENWYSVTNKTLLKARGYVLKHYTLEKALAIAYPELKFELEFRTHRPSGHWQQSEHARAFFDEFARTSGFDPRLPENWYPITIRTLIQAGGAGVLNAYGSIVHKALMFAYPELNFAKERFRTHNEDRYERGYWRSPPNVRAVFDEFAKKAGFDPLVPKNWYSVRIKTLRNAGLHGLLKPYNYNLKDALSSAYPELNFTQREFISHQRKINKTGHWKDPTNVRAYFDELAINAGFDPLVAENWNAVKPSTLQRAGGGGVLYSFNNDVKKALSFAYPELDFGS